MLLHFRRTGDTVQTNNASFCGILRFRHAPEIAPAFLA